MSDNEDRELLNPYEQQAPRRFGPRLGRDNTLRRRAVVVIAGLLTLAIVGGTVGTSCAPGTTTVTRPDTTGG